MTTTSTSPSTGEGLRRSGMELAVTLFRVRVCACVGKREREGGEKENAFLSFKPP